MFKSKIVVPSAMLIALLSLAACSAKIDASTPEKAQSSLERALKGNDFEDLAKFQVGVRVLKGKISGMTFDEVKDAGEEQFKPALFGLGKGYDDEVSSSATTLEMLYKEKDKAAREMAKLLAPEIQ